jgi:hypothetical protein
LLVRYKNAFLDAEGVLAGMVDTIMANLDRHKQLLVRYGYLVCKQLSFRLKRLYVQAVRSMITHQLRRPVGELLKSYTEGDKSFNDTRLELRDLMNRIAVIEFRNYVRQKTTSGQD